MIAQCRHSIGNRASERWTCSLVAAIAAWRLQHGDCRTTIASKYRRRFEELNRKHASLLYTIGSLGDLPSLTMRLIGWGSEKQQFKRLSLFVEGCKQVLAWRSAIVANSSHWLASSPSKGNSVNSVKEGQLISYQACLCVLCFPKSKSPVSSGVFQRDWWLFRIWSSESGVQILKFRRSLVFHWTFQQILWPIRLRKFFKIVLQLTKKDLKFCKCR